MPSCTAWSAVSAGSIRHGGELTPLLRAHLVPEDPGAASLIRELRHVRRRGQFTRAEFLVMCRWKSPRAIARCESNSHHRVREVSRAMFMTRVEAERLDLLIGLAGVGIPTASAILTLTDPHRYGVIDIRAWQELHRRGVVRDRPGGQGFSPEHWLQYLRILRTEAARLGVTARQVEYSLFTLHQARQEGTLYKKGARAKV
jgi:hypothetical protein